MFILYPQERKPGYKVYKKLCQYGLNSSTAQTIANKFDTLEALGVVVKKGLPISNVKEKRKAVDKAYFAYEEAEYTSKEQKLVTNVVSTIDIISRLDSDTLSTIANAASNTTIQSASGNRLVLTMKRSPGHSLSYDLIP
jgi:3-methyladenine DNA glycosylase Tag